MSRVPARAAFLCLVVTAAVAATTGARGEQSNDALAKGTPTAKASPRGSASPTGSATPAPSPSPTAKAAKVEEFPPPPRPERENWRVGVENAAVTWRKPNMQSFTDLPPDKEIPEGSVIYVRLPARGKGRVRLTHKGGRVLEITTTSIVRLLTSELVPGDRPFRIALDELPSNLESEDVEEGMGAFDRLVSYFIPRVPIDETEYPPRLTKKPWMQNPIKPSFPGQVHLVESESLPAVVNFEWPLQGGQQEPHNFYLWMEGRFVQAPQAIVRGGRTSVPLSRFGKYFWQVEDKTGQYASSPRIIYVRRPGESLEEGVRPEPTPSPTPDPELAHDDPEGTFQLKSPRKKSVVLVCLAEGAAGSQIPLVVPNAVRNAKRYVVEVRPKLGDGKWVFDRTDERLAFETQIPVTRLGNFTFSVRAVLGGKEGLEILGDETPVRITDVCAGRGLAGQGAFAQALQRNSGDPFPEAGATVLLPPRGEP